KGVGFGNAETINVEDLDLTAVSLRKAPRSGARRSDDGSGTMLGGGRVEAGRVELARDQPQSGVQPRSPIVATEGSKALALLDRAIQAKGGFEALRGIKSITAVSRSSSATPKGPVDSQTTTYLQYPNHVRVETKMPDTTIVQVYDGTQGWVKGPGG